MTKNTWATVETNKSPKGIANIKVGNNKVKITFEDGKIDKVFHKNDLPDVPKNLKTGRYFVSLSNDKSEVTRIGPVNMRDIKMRCVDFVRPEEGAEPEPKEYEGKGGKYTYLAFTALLEAQDGMFKGCQFPTFMSYLFTDDGTGTTAFKNSNSKYADKVRDFCVCTGLTEEQIPWPEDGNVLPAFLATVLQKKRVFNVDVKDGYPAAFFVEDSYQEDDFEDEDEKLDKEMEELKDELDGDDEFEDEEFGEEDPEFVDDADL